MSVAYNLHYVNLQLADYQRKSPFWISGKGPADSLACGKKGPVRTSPGKRQAWAWADCLANVGPLAWDPFGRRGFAFAFVFPPPPAPLGALHRYHCSDMATICIALRTNGNYDACETEDALPVLVQPYGLWTDLVARVRSHHHHGWPDGVVCAFQWIGRDGGEGGVRFLRRVHHCNHGAGNLAQLQR